MAINTSYSNLLMCFQRTSMKRAVIYSRLVWDPEYREQMRRRLKRPS